MVCFAFKVQSTLFPLLGYKIMGDEMSVAK